VRRKRKADDEGETGKSPKKKRVVSRPEVAETDSEAEVEVVMEQMEQLREETFQGFTVLSRQMEEHTTLLLRVAEALEGMVWIEEKKWAERHPEEGNGPEEAGGSKEKGQGPEDPDATQK
jgi:hypothetical protein